MTERQKNTRIDRDIVPHLVDEIAKVTLLRTLFEGPGSRASIFIERPRDIRFTSGVASFALPGIWYIFDVFRALGSTVIRISETRHWRCWEVR